MKTVSYQFSDGTKSEVQVSDEFYEKYQAFEDEEQKNNRRETRRHISLDYLNEFAINFTSEDQDASEVLIKDEMLKQLEYAITTLEPNQRELIKKVFYKKLSVTEIAKNEGVDVSSICKRLTRIYNRLKKFLV